MKDWYIYWSALLSTIRIWVWNNYANINYAQVSDLLKQPSIKTENHLMGFSDSSWKYFQETDRSKRAYIIFYQGVKIDHRTHVPVPVAQSST